MRLQCGDIGAVTSNHPRIIDHEDILGVALITAARAVVVVSVEAGLYTARIYSTE